MVLLTATGDSNTDAAAGYVTAAQVWPALLASRLGITVANTGKAGRYAEGVLNNVNSMIMEPSAPTVFLLIGTNNAFAGHQNGTPASEMVAVYAAAVQGTIDACKRSGMTLWLVSPPLSKRAEVNSRIWQLRDALVSLASMNGLSLLDLTDRMDVDARNSTTTFRQWFLTDVLDDPHLGVTGHSRVADFLQSTPLSTDPIAGPDPAHIGTIYSAALTSQFGNLAAPCSFRTVIPPTATPPNRPGFIRAKVRASATEQFVVSKLFAGEPLAVPSANYLLSMKVSGAVGWTHDFDEAKWTDWRPISWDRTRPLMFSGVSIAGTGGDLLRANSGVTGAWTGHKFGDGAADLMPSGYSNFPGWLSYVEEIQTDGF